MAKLERNLGLALTAIGLAVAILTVLYVGCFCAMKALAFLEVPEGLEAMASRWTPTLALTAMMIILSSVLMKVGTDLVRQWLASRPPEEVTPTPSPTLRPSPGPGVPPISARERLPPRPPTTPPSWTPPSRPPVEERVAPSPPGEVRPPRREGPEAGYMPTRPTYRPPLGEAERVVRVGPSGGPSEEAPGVAPVISRPSAPQVERPGAEVRPAERPVSEARAPPAPSPPTPTPAPKPAEEAPGEARAEVRREIPREARAGFTEDELSRILRILRERRRRP